MSRVGPAQDPVQRGLDDGVGELGRERAAALEPAAEERPPHHVDGHVDKVNWLFGESSNASINILELLEPFCKGGSIIFSVL